MLITWLVPEAVLAAVVLLIAALTPRVDHG